jgi:hypothetical protein
VASILIMAISLVFISLFTFQQFSGWVALYLLCLIPMELVASVTWGSAEPGFVGRASQPLRGILLMLICAVVGVAVTWLHWVFAGASVSPPAPMLTMCIIASVVIMFWFAIMFGGWPFTTLIKNKVAAGFVMLVACYLVNYGLFRVFFNYDFMQGAPVYVASLDPHGLYNAWDAVVFIVTAVAPLFLVALFDMWPLSKSPTLMKQPMLGIVWTIIALIIGGGAFYIGVVAMHMDPMKFLLSVTIPFIFGTIIMLNMMQNSVFAKFQQPLKGVLNLITSIVVGEGLAILFSSLAPVVTGNLKEGPPAYDHEIWLASALLSVTFPFLVAYVDFFQMWPLQRAKAEKAMESVAGR